MEDFLFHKVSEKEKEEIKKKAKQIMDSFSKKLSKIDEKSEEPFVEREDCERTEGVPIGMTQSADQRAFGKCEDLDRDLMFENSPSKNKDFIIAEKGGWE